MWTAVLLDSYHPRGFDKLPLSGLIKLRDLPENIWNVDTLYVLTPDARSARRLADMIESEDWGGMVQVHEGEGVGHTLGTTEQGQAIISVWWD